MAEFAFDWVMEKLKTVLTPERYEHSVGVMETAVTLAARFGADEEKAKIAGILHDCAKILPRRKAIAYVKHMGFTLDAVTQRSYKMVHQYLGAELARESVRRDRCRNFGCDSLSYDGKADMTLLDKVLYLADFQEPNPAVKEPLRDLTRCVSCERH